MMQTVVVNCPTCNDPVVWNLQNIYRPFCCKRCQLIDLDEWATEKRAIIGDTVIDHDNDYNDDDGAEL